MISDRLQKTIRTVNDFPKPGISFKDLTPVFKDAKLCLALVDAVVGHFAHQNIKAVVGIESRGFLLGSAIAFKLGVAFVPIRKKGKLPFTTLAQSYELEYGFETIEMHTDALEKGDGVLIHDDVLATGGTAEAAGKLVSQAGGIIKGYSFIAELAFLNGRKRLRGFDIQSLTTYN